ncbi:MAG: DUF5058 family protein [Clostridiales bacterium]|jgi:hypothetical protein|nr:DUF5058 family protein [Clostridiales bacterium]
MDLNAGIIFLIVAVVILVVASQAVFFLIKAYREGIRIGMSRETLNKAITSSAVFSILPSVGIMVTMFGLIEFLGIPFSWLRLSVVGSINYELSAADTAAQTVFGTSIGDAIMTPEGFVTIALVMTFGMILGGFLCIFGLKKYSAILKKPKKESVPLTADGAEIGGIEQPLAVSIAAENDTQNASAAASTAAVKKKKLNFAELGNLVFLAVFIALCAAYIGSAIGTAFGDFRIEAYTSVVPFISMLVAVGSMAVFMKLQKKHPWLQSFSLSFSMLIGMVSAIPISLLLGVIF